MNFDCSHNSDRLSAARWGAVSGNDEYTTELLVSVWGFGYSRISALAS